MNAADKPVPKVQAAGAAGAASVILVWIAGKMGVDVTAEVAAAITALLAFAGGYFKRSYPGLIEEVKG